MVSYGEERKTVIGMAKVQIKELEADDYNLFENIKTAFYRLWKQKIIVFLATAFAVCLSLIYVGKVGIKIKYYTTATVYSVVYGSSNESYSGASLMNTYADLISTSRVCNRAAISLAKYGYSSERLQSMAKAGNIYLSGASASAKNYSYKLLLYVISPSLDSVPLSDITIIANAMAEAFVAEINDISGTASLQVMDEAKSISRSQSMNTKTYMLIFAAAGFVLSCAIIFIKEFFSNKVYTIGQCENDKNQILGILPLNLK